MCVWHGNESYPWALSVWPPVSDPSLDLQGQSWQSLHRPCTLMSTWGPVSSAYQKHSLHVSCVSPILSWGLLGWENAFHSYLFSVENEGRRGVAITLATQLHSIPLFDQALGRLLPQLHHGGGVWTQTHRIKLSRLLQLKSLHEAISITLTAQTVFGSACHSITTKLLQTRDQKTNNVSVKFEIINHYWQ